MGAGSISIHVMAQYAYISETNKGRIWPKTFLNMHLYTNIKNMLEIA